MLDPLVTNRRRVTASLWAALVFLVLFTFTCGLWSCVETVVDPDTNDSWQRGLVPGFFLLLVVGLPAAAGMGYWIAAGCMKRGYLSFRAFVISASLSAGAVVAVAIATFGGVAVLLGQSVGVEVIYMGLVWSALVAGISLFSSAVWWRVASDDWGPAKA